MYGENWAPTTGGQTALCCRFRVLINEASPLISNNTTAALQMALTSLEEWIGVPAFCSQGWRCCSTAEHLTCSSCVIGCSPTDNSLHVIHSDHQLRSLCPSFHPVNIANSQEWTLSRSIPELRLVRTPAPVSSQTPRCSHGHVLHLSVQRHMEHFYTLCWCPDWNTNHISR